ncbi:hypothetical protein GF386_06585 [Candidatus Pacearchaeota archaeon]|nr:hypothetical protein [Candidatus Pacearchaeota archaeon]MBD3283761.1 hypothetical protein [Candidatus Pacearchaeota archaeon]
MTTILGIRAGKDNGIVLASDLQSTSLEELTKISNQKLYVSQDRKLVLAMSGIRDEKWDQFRGDVLSGKIDIRKRIQEGVFPEFRDLNIERCNGTIFNQNEINSMLLAVNYDEPQLYVCWPLGAVNSKDIAFDGSGSKYVEEYLKSRSVVDYVEDSRLSVDPTTLKLPDTRRHAYFSLVYASRHDLGSSGLDMVVMTPKEVIEYQGRLRDLNERYTRELIRVIENGEEPIKG